MSTVSPDPSFGHVVVAGGSVSGLLAALVLSRHADRVTVLERDHYPGGPEPRSGVPQSRHTHVLLTSGIQALDELLPGVVDELRAADAPYLSVPADVGVWQAGQWVSRDHPSQPVMSASRPLLEQLVRRRVLAAPRIRVWTSTAVTGLLGRADQVTGVTVRDRGTDQQSERAIEADLVVDATGRASRFDEWLAGLGGAPVAEETLETGRAYATCVFHADEQHFDRQLRGFYIVPEAAQTLGAIILPAEGDRWMATLSGPRGQAPPTDPAGFVDFARDLPHQAPHTFLRSARPIGKPVGYRHTGNRRRRYDQGRDRRGLLVVGDAACAFNPVYGQGVSVAAMNATALERLLTGTRVLPSTHRMQRVILRSSQAAWEIATGADSHMPGAEGNAARTGPLDLLLNRYLDRVRDRVPGDPVVCRAFRDVLFLLAPPSSLLTSYQVVRRSLLHPVAAPRSDVLTP
ncbi:FAD-dependent oxidoreductase [Actinoalloteichus hymeniacidonis]|uniref:2-polyprenyl-6-methoxyphenol hydroxylase-like oxidoreductase n=1 Tax=Actinoalloteichus hymeniacidonis TaxID=340345 RepID=A0AAC9MZY2_9PSEU|nr:FAD-dependent monooxygenase [Actinoalloteichus hymeniacidonis]AOS64502.1 2-polyprenyl-6-methoxyphenol hydroxylase-like oxidoreductase [Actinoalloteichus hymeniacidonis]MBB5907427.1 2-polyprenyl-6-methoxyphenol hydroxylase-like FAD-dependent oxidoreductase [Actinoalloteichus hymeniacidonis]